MNSTASAVAPPPSSSAQTSSGVDDMSTRLGTRATGTPGSPRKASCTRARCSHTSNFDGG
eukprot:4396744-Heterocapsa_arctica.AAC.1